jgi:ankyrin repeat protein
LGRPFLKGITALILAAKHGHIGCIQVLVDHDASLDYNNKVGQYRLKLANPVSNAPMIDQTLS